MTIKSELARLKDKARALREARENVCTCERLIIIEGEPTPEQQQLLDVLRPCRVHSEVLAVVEVGRSPMFRPTEVQEAFELEN